MERRDFTTVAHHSDAGELLSRSPGFLAPCRVDLSNSVFCFPIPSVTVWPQRCALQTQYFQLPVLTQPCFNLAHDCSTVVTVISSAVDLPISALLFHTLSLFEFIMNSMTHPSLAHTFPKRIVDFPVVNH